MMQLKTKIGSVLPAGIKNKIKSLLDRSPQRPPKTFLISFPKCGRTWLRLMVGRAIVNHFALEHPDLKTLMLELEPLGELDPRVPYIKAVHDDAPQWKKADELTPTKERFSGKKVILLVRDPRDVVVSCFFEHKKRVAPYLKNLETEVSDYKERLKPYEGDLNSYVYEEVGSLATVIKYYNIWAENRDLPSGLLLVRYEDLHQQTAAQLKRVLEFVGVTDVSQAVIDEAVQFASFNNMRKMEAENQFNSFKLRPTDPNDQESYKTRKGKIGGYLDYLDDPQIEYINSEIQQKLSEFYGY